MTTWCRRVIGCALPGVLAFCLVLTGWAVVLNVLVARSTKGPLVGDTITVCALTSATPPMRVGLSWDTCPGCAAAFVNAAQWRQAACLSLSWPFGLPFGQYRGTLTP